MTKLLISILSCLLVLSVSAAKDENKQVYVVYMGALPSDVEYMPTSHHMNILQEVIGESSTEDRLVRSYKRSFNGFAANLTESERERLARMEGVVSVFPNRKLKLQTTASWDFMGLKENTTKRVPNVESDIIIGVIDTGIWPESASFEDKGFSSPPKKWKGQCAGGKNFTCNNKLIGARTYVNNEESATARDYEGHGSHTASTAAGNHVEGVSFYGLGLGTVRGGVPAARIAAYKACGPDGCPSDAMLSSFDDAIADGVDVITISIGLAEATEFEKDAIAIGAFHAMAKGILTVNSVGNEGPSLGHVVSVAPWMLSVAASNINRVFVTKVVLGDGKIVAGRSTNTFDLNGTKYPLVYGKSASTTSCDESAASLCSCLDNTKVKGKIVMCDIEKGSESAQSAGAVGAIVMSPDADASWDYPFPVSVLSRKDYEAVQSYVNSTKDPEASILKVETIRDQPAPIVVSFSARGPNVIASDILKPDLTAPGVEILAAYSPDSTPSMTAQDTRHVKYSILSGTSMACPHVAGAAAYLKTFHPTWSPSMIKSAIMTTTWPMNASVNADAEFAYGSGHLDPLAALNPGLVYESTIADHITFLCGMNYTETSLRMISGDNITCTKEQAKTLPRNLNYPSMSAKVPSEKAFDVKFLRTVTNVGMPKATYRGSVVKGAGTPNKLNVKVEPDVLSFESVWEKKSFAVTASGEGLGTDEIVSATLVWSDGVHTVRSPVVVYASALSFRSAFQ